MKRISMIVSALLCLLLAVGTFLPTSAACVLRGDADGDGGVTISDVTAIQRKLSSLSTPSLDERAADVDGDGVNITDATMIQRYLAGFENIYHINESFTVPDPTAPQPTVPQPTFDPYKLPVVPKK